MPDPNWKPDGPPQGNRFFQKLGVYLLGVAIGLVFLGWVQYRKHQAAQNQPAAPDARQAEPAQPDAAPPPDSSESAP
jgi:hypothetical protein